MISTAAFFGFGKIHKRQLTKTKVVLLKIKQFLQENFVILCYLIDADRGVFVFSNIVLRIIIVDI